MKEERPEVRIDSAKVAEAAKLGEQSSEINQKSLECTRRQNLVGPLNQDLSTHAMLAWFMFRPQDTAGSPHHVMTADDAPTTTTVMNSPTEFLHLSFIFTHI